MSAPVRLYRQEYRPVWVLPQTEIKLAKGKSLRTQAVDVVEVI